MDSIAYYDGHIGAPDELMVPFNDRGHFFGDGIYEAAMGVNGKIFCLEDHLDRFYSSAVNFDIRIPLEKQALADVLLDLLSQVDDGMKVVYWQVTRGVAPREHIYDESMVGRLWVMIRPDVMRNPADRMRLISLEDRRFGYGNVKTLNLLPAVKYSQHVRRLGLDEAVLHREGFVTECAHSNISILKDGVFYSHPNDEYILRGIAKTHLIQACYRLAIPVIERAFTLEQLHDCDEAIVSSSSDLCIPVCELDGAEIGGRDPETLKRLSQAVYQEFLDQTGLEAIF